MASAIDKHPQKQRIIDGLLAGESLRKIAASVTPSVSHVVIQRYRKSVVAPALNNASVLTRVLHQNGLLDPVEGEAPEAVQAKQLTSLALTSDPILARIAKHQATLDDSIIDARADKDARGVASLVGTDLKGLELHCRLTGRLDASTGPTVAIQIVCPAGSEPRISSEDGGVVLDITPQK
jgi:hypothetical protein